MSIKDDGGPAFPHYTREGMSLLDWYAGQALAGMVQDHGNDCNSYREGIARRAYLVGTAMLAERKAWVGK